MRGSKAKRILDSGHESLSVHGIGQDLSKEQWGSICDTLLDVEAIESSGEYRTLQITNIGVEILKKLRSVKIDKKHLDEDKSYKEYKKDIISNKE